MTEERSFTRAEVEALIPRLQTIMDVVMTSHRDAGAIKEAVVEEQQAIAMSGGGVIDQAAWRERKARLDDAVARVESGLKDVLALGGVPKDLALGLVDFAHRREGKVINLCWKSGERAIDWWHGLDEGYGARKPL
ncbi:MAG: DUF2203 domain-containing protein [Candidatus Rokubacteria bacterium]|nr:DUF2203 domain-containing protein [Candidatus Rokubacteria bacterium]